jgi:hypothetical protein
MQASHASVGVGREGKVGSPLGIVAAILWIATLIALFWNQQYVNAHAPTEGFVLVLGIVSFLLMAVLAPFATGAYVAWRRRGHAHPVITAAGVTLLAQWAFLIVGGGALMVLTDPKAAASYLSTGMNIIEILLVLVVFGLDAALMGAAGGAVAARVRRELAGRSESPSRLRAPSG